MKNCPHILAYYNCFYHTDRQTDGHTDRQSHTETHNRTDLFLCIHARVMGLNISFGAVH